MRWLVLASAGHAVVALDCDPNPMLGITLGFGPERTEAAPAVLNMLVEMGHTHNDPDPILRACSNSSGSKVRTGCAC